MFGPAGAQKMKYTREQLAAWMQDAGFSLKEKQDYLDNNLFVILRNG